MRGCVIRRLTENGRDNSPAARVLVRWRHCSERWRCCRGSSCWRKGVRGAGSRAHPVASQGGGWRWCGVGELRVTMACSICCVFGQTKGTSGCAGEREGEGHWRGGQTKGTSSICCVCGQTKGTIPESTNFVCGLSGLRRRNGAAWGRLSGGKERETKEGC
jgi:hypothetical protein